MIHGLLAIIVLLIVTCKATDIGHECMMKEGGGINDCVGFMQCCRRKCPNTGRFSCTTKRGQIDKRVCECPDGSKTVYTSYGRKTKHTGQPSDSVQETSAGGDPQTSQCVSGSGSCQELRQCCLRACQPQPFTYSCEMINERLSHDSTCRCRHRPTGSHCASQAADCRAFKSCCDGACGNRVSRMACNTREGHIADTICQCV